MNYRVLLSAPGWEIRLLGDGSEVKICSIADDLLLSSAEFNALALHAPLVGRMVKKLAQLDNFYPNDEELEQLLEDIAELEKG